MTNTRRAVLSLIMITAASALNSCSADKTPTQPAKDRVVDAVSVTPAQATIHVGQTAQASAVASNPSGAAITDAEFQWASSDANIATVDQAGVITAVSLGTTSVTASAGAKSSAVTVTVIPVPVASVVVSLSASSVVAGDSVSASAVTRDADGNSLSGRSVTWESSNPSVATISSSGAVATAAPGTTTITATSEGITGTAVLTVDAPPVEDEPYGEAIEVVVVAQPTSGVSGQSLTPSFVAEIRDENGHRVRNATDLVKASISDGSASSISGAQVNAVEGRATFSNLQITGTGTFVLRFEAMGLFEGYSNSFTLSTAASPPPLTTTQAVASITGTVNTALSATIPVTASGGSTPYSYALSGGSLPAGVTFNTSTGSVSGTPTAALTATTYTVTVTDAAAATSSKTFTLTVNPAPEPEPEPQPQPTAQECATPQAGWIFCDDFEVDRLSSYFYYDNANGKLVRAAEKGLNGSVGFRANYAAGQSGEGYLKVAFGKTPSSTFHPVDAGTANYREVYWRFYVRREPGWVTNGAVRLTRATILAASDWSQAMVAPAAAGGSSNNYIVLDPMSGTNAAGTLQTSGYSDVAHMRSLGSAQSAAPEHDSAHVGEWACYEFHVKLNDAGQSNGLFEFKVNNQLSASTTGLNWVGSYSAYGINGVFLDQVFKGGPSAANARVIDNLVVSTQPIGCLSTP